MYLQEEIQKKWGPILDHADLPSIRDTHRRSVTAVVLENTEKALREASSHGQFQTLTETTSGGAFNGMGASSSTAGAGPIDTFDPVLISLVRRSMPNLISYDVCGTQPMTGPTGLIFAMRSRYGNSAALGNTSAIGNTKAGGETFYNEVDTTFASVTTGANTFGQKFVGTIPGDTNTSIMSAVNGYNTGTAMSTAQAEVLGADGNSAFAQMGFSIEKVTVTAKSRALKAEYTMELAQDLKAIHGLDAESELSNILAAEIMAEINREVVRTINITAVTGALDNTTTAGV
jgi:hypothetical protein